jgi:alkanesulfonate monooxygenase SsuD/methylene tetrahydromethanopterin reductase-like flavin-dependent oxidoreductase (luciferase family)
MAAPKLGYLCLSENPTNEAGRALIRQFVLIREAERMGYDDIWIGEHHFDSHWPHGASAPLLGHLAAVTSKSRIGSLVTMPALRNSIAMAEEVATLDLLSKGRFELGVASGAAFPKALAAHGLNGETARACMLETLAKVQALLGGEALSGATAESPLDLQLKPAQAAVPISVATDDEATLRHAAAQGWGLIAAATHTQARVRRAVQIYTEASGGRAPALTLARFASTAATHEEALAIAKPYFDTLVTRAQAHGWGADAERSIARNINALISDSLLGTHAEVAEQFKAMAERYGATRVAIVPTSAQFDTHKHILADFVDEVRPMLEED